MRLKVDNMCFACGRGNPIGLRLEFRFVADDYTTTFEVRPEHQGWAGVVHGGLLATVLDETMARLLWEKEINAITGRLEVRYHKPVQVGDTVEVRGRITRQRPPIVMTAAEAVGNDGSVVAEATAISKEV